MIDAAYATSCATCWPRVCDPNRSECRRRPNTTHCPTCKHPWDYITDGTCTMPVLPGTNIPPSRSDQRTDRCGCAQQPPQPQPEQVNPTP